MTLAVVGIVRIQISLMNAYHKALQVYPVNIHYMIVLSELENYSLPTNNHILVKEYYSQHIFPWYITEQQLYNSSTEDVFWYLNYE